MARISNAGWLVPTTGNPFPVGNRIGLAVGATTTFDTLRVTHPAHERVINGFDIARLTGIASGAGRKFAIGSLAPSGSGKTSSIVEFARRTALGRAPAGGRPAAPVVMVPIDNGCTNRRLWASVLEMHDDPPGKGTEETFRDRAYATMRRAGTEMLVFDEVQHLVRSPNARDVTDSLKRILDDGVVTLGFIGTEQARPLLTKNIQLANRMLAPVDIRPLDFRLASDRHDFAAFVEKLDAGIVGLGILQERSHLEAMAVTTRLFIVSGGVVGVAVNLVRQALWHAVARGAARIEPYDLSHATDSWAVPTNVCRSNPFLVADPKPEKKAYDGKTQEDVE